ncbi:hypothetical protein Hanom_Chr15g01352381 [Helianthus anomalus]
MSAAERKEPLESKAKVNCGIKDSPIHTSIDVVQLSSLLNIILNFICCYPIKNTKQFMF